MEASPQQTLSFQHLLEAVEILAEIVAQPYGQPQHLKHKHTDYVDETHTVEVDFLRIGAGSNVQGPNDCDTRKMKKHQGLEHRGLRD